MGNINLSKLRKSLASIAIVSMLFSNFLFLENAFAISGPSFTANQTVANVTAVSQVKASRTLTINSQPSNGETITIGSCVITFDNSGSDSNCNNGVATVNSSSNNSTTASRIEAISNVSDILHGTLSDNNASNTITYTTFGTETSATYINFVDGTIGDITSTSTTTGVVGISAVAQKVTFTPGSTISSGIKYRATVNSTDYDYTSNSGTTLSNILSTLRSSITSSPAVSCTEDGTKITCTATLSGTPFTYNAQILDLEAPVLTLNGSGAITQEFGSSYNDLGANWVDNLDGNGTVTSAFSGTVDTNTLGSYVLEYKKIDTAGNTSNIVSRIFNIVDTTAPVLALNGSGTITQEFGSVYTDLGADWTDNVDGSGTVTSSFSGTVDVNTLGTYFLEYKHTDSSSNVSNIETRTVEVIDTTSPAGVTVEYSTTGATNQDVIATLTGSNEALTGTLTHNFTGNTTYTFEYSDLLGNTGSIYGTVTWIDKEMPVINLISTGVTLERGNTYTETGAEWTDNVDGSGSFTNTGSFTSSGTIDINTVGSYIFTYDYTDSAGNNAEQLTRVVEVVDTTSPAGVTVEYSTTGATNQDVIATLTGSNEALTGTLTHNFTGNTTYTFEYSDLLGNTGSIDGTVTWIDVEGPNKVSTSINDGQIGISTKSSSFDVEFSEDMQVIDDSKITLEKISSGSNLSLGKIGTKGTYLYINYDDLEYDTVYKFKINSGAVADLAGNIYTGDIEINFTTQSSIAPTILTLSTSNITSTSARVNYTTDIVPDEKEYRISTISGDGTWLNLSSSPMYITTLTPDTTYYYELRFKKDGQTSYSQVHNFKTSISDTGIIVNSQLSLTSNPVVGADFGSGYHFRFNVTINDLNETLTSFKLADWSNGLTTLPILGNTKMIISQNGYSDYSSAVASGGLVNVENNYLNYVDISSIDINPLVGGRQIIIDVFYKIPTGAQGSYSTSYGINSKEEEPENT